MTKRIKKFFKRLYKALMRPDIVYLPGQIAFFLVLATIPTMSLLSYTASILNLSLDFIERFLTMAFSKTIADLILSVNPIKGAGFGFFFVLLVCYYLSSNGTASIIAASNVVYGIKNKNFFKRRAKAILMSLIFIVVLNFLIIVPVFGRKIIELIYSVNMNPSVTKMIHKVYIWLKSPITWIILFFLIKMLYIIAPDRRIKSKEINYGALFTTASWIIITALYSYYINNIADYTAFYGGLTSVCVLMIWFYFLSYTFVVGMVLNHLKEKENIEEYNDNK